MIIEKVSFENYRNLKNNEIVPGKNVNVIYGDNAQGKTNLLELMWLFTGGRSFRGAKDKELIEFSKDKSKINLDFFSGGRSQNIKIDLNTINTEVKKTAYLNSVYKKAMSLLIGNFCGVIFSPIHLSLVKNGPGMRRKFIDAAICQIQPSYPSYLAEYNKALFQRNTLIKNSVYNNSAMDVWETSLARAGIKIIEKRLKYCIKLKKNTDSIYKELSVNGENISFDYNMSFENKNDLLQDFIKALKNKRNSDIKYGCTSIGPHRDDIDIKINGLCAKNYASQGQQRFIVLALKLSEAKILEQAINEKPVIFLDDVLSELDNKRQDYLIKNIDGFQVFITCCEINDLIKNSKSKLFSIKNGIIE